MKKFAYTIVVAAALLSAPAMANELDQHNMAGHYNSTYFSNTGYHGVKAGRWNSGEALILDRSEIKNMQAALKEAGYRAGPVDGVIGSQTRAALRAFQADHRLKGNGAVTERTLKTLEVLVLREEQPTRRNYRRYN